MKFSRCVSALAAAGLLASCSHAVGSPVAYGEHKVYGNVGNRAHVAGRNGEK